MPDLQEQLNSILSDPNAMSQIAAIAQSLGAGQNTGGTETPQEPKTTETAGGASELSGSVPVQDPLSGLDPRLLQMAMGLLSEYNSAQSDPRLALLDALEPHLQPRRQETLARAKRAARLARVIRSAMGMLREGGDHV